MKPSDMACNIPHCPYDGKPAQGEWYKPRKKDIDNCLEFVIHHGINGLIESNTFGQKAKGRNYFHYTGVLRPIGDDEKTWTWHANPNERPNWEKLKKMFKK